MIHSLRVRSRLVVVAGTVAFGVLGALGLAACGSSGSTAGGPSTTSSTTAPAAAPVSVHDADNGRTFTVPAGADVQLVLDSTYWKVAGADRVGVLRAVGATSYQPGQCPPGIGCGTTTAKFIAVGPGTVHLRASRLTCGEALRCQGPQRVFAVTVVVRA